MHTVRHAGTTVLDQPHSEPRRRRSGRRAAVAVLAAVTVIGISACGDDTDDSDGDEDAGAAASTSTAEQEAPTPATDASWGTSFAPPDGVFTAEFPGEPERQDLEAPVPGVGTVPVTTYLSESGDRGYAIASTELPNPVPEGDVQGTLDAARDGSVGNVGAELLESTATGLQGRPGIEFAGTVVSNGVSGMIISRIYLDGGVMYQLMVTGPGDFSSDDEDVTAFFDSFGFTTE